MNKHHQNEKEKLISRRFFLKASIATAGSLQFALLTPALGQENKPQFDAGAYIRVLPDNSIIITIGQSEMGQGSLTGMAQIIAEELDANWDQVTVHKGGFGADFFRPQAPIQVTGGSGSIRSFYTPLRQAGAAARQVFITAAAETWNMTPDVLRTDNGQVLHPDGRVIAYGNLIETASGLDLPDLAVVPLKSPEEFKFIGTRSARVDGHEKVNGRADYGLDLILPDMLSAVVLHPPRFGSQLLDYNAADASQMPGVLDIFPLSSGLAIVAKSYWQAQKAREIVTANWSDKGPGFQTDAENLEQMQSALTGPGLPALNRGNTSSTPNQITTEFHVPHLAHACMEPLNATVWIRKDKAEIWTGTQFQTATQNVVASVSGIKPSNVEVHTPYLGGGFGRRSSQDFVRLATEIAMKFTQPVKLIYSREDDMKAGRYRPAALCQMAAQLDASGSITSFSAKMAVPSLVEHTGLKFLMGPNGVDSTAVEGLDEKSFPYNIPNVQSHWVKHDPGVPVWFWRSVGASQNFYFLETFMDQLAKAAKRDPLEFRLAHVTKHPRHRRVLEEVAKLANWGTSLPEGHAQGIAVAESFGSVCAQIAEVEIIDGEAVVHKVTAVLDAGRVINPGLVEAQIQGSIIYALSALLTGQISFEDGQVIEDNFSDYEVLRINQTPEMEIKVLSSDAPPAGVGEPATPPLAPAVCNALLALTGKPILSLPLRGTDLNKV